MRTFRNPFWLCIVLALLFCSCQKPGLVLEESKTLSNDGWKYTDVQVFQVEINDTTSLYDLAVNIRHSNDYENANLWLKMRTTYPSGKVFEAPVNIQLSEENGKWLGSGIQSILSRNQQIFAKSRMPEIGTYRFEISQNMRRNPLLEIRDIGISLAKSQ